jgi:hypothetical protein
VCVRAFACVSMCAYVCVCVRAFSHMYTLILQCQIQNRLPHATHLAYVEAVERHEVRRPRQPRPEAQPPGVADTVLTERE